MSFINTIRMKALEFKSKISKKGLVLSDQVKKTLASWEEKEVKVILLLEKGVIAPMIAWTNTPPEEMKRRELIEIILEKKFPIVVWV